MSSLLNPSLAEGHPILADDSPCTLVLLTSLAEAITHLVSVGYATATMADEGTDASRKRQRRSGDEGDSGDGQSASSSSGMRNHPLYIEARLNSRDFKETMDKVAASNQVREAWRSGTPLPDNSAGNRFKVVAGLEYDDWSEAVCKKIDWTMMEEGRDWWEADGIDS